LEREWENMLSGLLIAVNMLLIVLGFYYENTDFIHSMADSVSSNIYAILPVANEDFESDCDNKEINVPTDDPIDSIQVDVKMDSVGNITVREEQETKGDNQDVDQVIAFDKGDDEHPLKSSDIVVKNDVCQVDMMVDEAQIENPVVEMDRNNDDKAHDYSLCAADFENVTDVSDIIAAESCISTAAGMENKDFEQYDKDTP
jgi:hypothetical protein